VPGHARRLGHVPDVEDVVGYALTLAHGELGRADVQAPVHLHRVGVDDLAAERVCQAQRQVGLAGGGRPDDRDYAGSHVATVYWTPYGASSYSTSAVHSRPAAAPASTCHGARPATMSSALS